MKQQIKLTLKSAAPPLKKLANRFDDDSEDEGMQIIYIDAIKRGSLKPASINGLGWEKEKVVPASVPQPPPVPSSNQPARKRAAESPPPAAPPSKVNNSCQSIRMIINNSMCFVCEYR